jgi:hypothetical protein
VVEEKINMTAKGSRIAVAAGDVRAVARRPSAVLTE